MYKKIVLFLSLVIAAIVLYFSITSEKTVMFQNPFDQQVHFQYPSYATIDEAKNIYLIDDAMKRVIKVNDEGQLIYMIAGGKREEGEFFYANELTVDEEGCLYILNHVLDENGIYMEREEIIKYNTKGRFEKVIYSKTYNKEQQPWTLIRRGRILSIEAREGNIHWYNLNKDNIVYEEVSTTTGTMEKTEVISFEQADVVIADIVRMSDTEYVYSTKKGEIYKADSNHQDTLIYAGDAMKKGAVRSIPWALGADEKGNIYFTDLGQRQIIIIDQDLNIQPVVSKEGLEEKGYASDYALFEKLDVKEDGTVVSINQEYILLASLETGISSYRSTGEYNIAYTLRILLSWVQILVMVVLLLIAASIIYIDFMNRHIPPVVKKSFILIATLVVSTVIVTNIIFDNFTKRYTDSVKNQMSQLVQQVPKSIGGDRLEKIVNLRDFMNEDYEMVREQLHASLNYNRDKWNNRYYGAIYKIEHNQLYAFMYFNDSIGTHFPMNIDLQDPEYYFYDAYTNGTITTATEIDSLGNWLYALGPIYNAKDEIIGIIEIGTDQNEFVQGNNRLLKELGIEMATVLVIFLFAMIEVTILNDILTKRKQSRAEDSLSYEGGHDSDIIRPLTFIIFIAMFMSLTFIPILMKNLYDPSYGISESIMIAIPISVEMLFAGISKVISGYMIDKKGWKVNLYSGLGILLIGTILSGMAMSPVFFIMARAVVGVGNGFSIIALRSLVNANPSAERRNTGFVALNSGAVAGINVGIAIGAILTDQLGFNGVFYIAAVIVAAAMVFVMLLTKGTPVVQDSVAHREKTTSHVFIFLTDRKVMAFFILILIPGYLCGMFLNYFFPLFAESNHISTANVGRIFILNGLCVMYLGPFLSKVFEKYLGNKLSLIFSVTLGAVALFIFALTGNTQGAVVTVILLGVMDSFGIAAQNNYFLSFDAVKKVGEAKAIGFFELVGNVGEMIGPIVFGAALVAGDSLGIMIVAIVSLGTLGLYLILTKGFSHSNKTELSQKV